MHPSQDVAYINMSRRVNVNSEKYIAKSKERVNSEVISLLNPSKKYTIHELAKEVYKIVIGDEPTKERYRPCKICSLELSCFEHALRNVLEMKGYGNPYRLNGKQFDILSEDNLLYRCTKCNSAENPLCGEKTKQKMILNNFLKKQTPQAIAQYTRIMKALGLEH